MTKRQQQQAPQDLEPNKEDDLSSSLHDSRLGEAAVQQPPNYGLILLSTTATQTKQATTPSVEKPPSTTPATITPSTSSSDQPAQTISPYVIFPVKELNRLLGGVSVQCGKCKNKVTQLRQTTKKVIVTHFQLWCDFCKTDETKRKDNVKYLSKKRKSVDHSTVDGRQLSSDLRNKINYQKRRISTLRDLEAVRTVRFPLIQNWGNPDLTKQPCSNEYQLNVRTMLCAFINGTGGLDISRTLTMMGLGGGTAFKRFFYRNAPYVHEKIVAVVNGLINESLKKEVTATTNEFKENKVLKCKNGETINNILTNKNLTTQNDEIPTIPIAVSYDMGWQKRSGGRVYDSLSGHGFIIGCRTGKVVGMGVRKKKCKICSKYNRDEIEIPPHNCQVNHEGSSGSMEAGLALDLIKELYEKSKKKFILNKL